jgi:hypothetical protein
MDAEQAAVDPWLIQHMRDFAWLDVGNDRRDGPRVLYGMMRKGYERGEFTAAEWAAYHEAYEDELRRQRPALAAPREAPEVEEDADGFVWGARID